MSDMKRYFNTMNKIFTLPQEDQDLALKFYRLMIRVERLTYSFPFTGGFGGVLLGILIAVLANFSAMGSPALLIITMLAYYVAWFFLGKFTFEVLILNRLRNKALHKIKGMQVSDPRFYRIFKTLKKLDPRMVKNIGEFLPSTD